MKIKFTGTNPDPDVSLALVDDLVKNKIITDRDEQILGIYDEEVQLEGIYPSEELTLVLAGYPDWKINTDPSETDAFKPEEGLPDADKVGTVPDPTYKNEEEGEELIEDLKGIKLFPESEITFSEKSGERDNNNNFNNKTMSKRKNFDDPALNPEGVAIDATQTEVDVEQTQDDANYDPAGEGFSSVDVAPFTDEEIKRANDIEVESTDGEITVFSDEEIEEMADPDEVERLADEMELEETAFAERKKRLFSAKRRLRKVNSRRIDRKTFAEELSESEKSAVIEDIVAILEDAPEIKDAVAEEVEGLVTEAAEEPEAEVTEEVVETPAETEETTVEPEPETPAEEVTEEVTTEEEPVETEEEELDVEAFSEEEIEGAPETEVEETVEVTEEPAEEPEVTEEDEETNEGEEIGRVFCKAFSEDSVKNYRTQQLAKMAEEQSSYRTRRR